LTLLCLMVWGQAFAMRAEGDGGRFDADLLRIDEASYLGRELDNVTVLTETGEFLLSDLIANQPAILQLAYYGCGHACPVMLRNLSQLQLESSTEDYRVLVLSFDAKDTLESLRDAKRALGDIPGNWTFGLLADDEIQRLTDSTGFRFFFSESDQVFVHPSVLIFLSPDGEIMRYLFGSDFRARDIDLALVESRDRVSRLGEIVDMLKLSCFQFDAARSRYVLHPTVIFGIAGIGMLGLVGLAAFASRKHSRVTEY